MKIIFSIIIFVIGITPVYKMLITGTKIQTTTDKIYEASLNGERLLQSVKLQIEEGVPLEDIIGSSLDLGEQYKTESFLYDVYILPIQDKNLDNMYIENLISIGEITYKGDHNIHIDSSGFEVINISTNKLKNYPELENKISLIYKRHMEYVGQKFITHQIILEEEGNLSDKNIIQISVDLSTFSRQAPQMVIRIENKTRATAIIQVYGGKNLENIKVYPVQDNIDGGILMQMIDKPKLARSFIIEIVVKDANNHTFGSKDKVLSRISDIYAFDY